MSPRSCLMRSRSAGDESLPALAAEARHAAQPVRVELGAEIILEEVLARHAIGFRQPQQPALKSDETLVDVVELLDQRIDAVLVQRQRLDLRDHLILELAVTPVLAGRELRALHAAGDELVLQAAELLVVLRDALEGLHDLRLQLRFHRGKRDCVLVLVVILVAELFGGGLARRALLVIRTGRGRGARGGLRCGAIGAGVGMVLSVVNIRVVAGLDDHRRRRVLRVRPRIGGLQVDDVAEENLPLVELVLPDDDGLEGERGFAEARDHGLAAGLDALGDGDFALARQQLDGAHLAQIHAHRIVGAVGRLARRLGGDGSAGRLRDLAAFRLILGDLGGFLRLVGLDDVDAHLGQHRQHVFDLLGADLLRGQHGVELVVGDKAALLRDLDHLLDRGVVEVEKRPVVALGRGFRHLVAFLGLGRHVAPLSGSRSSGTGFGRAAQFDL